MHEDVQHPCIFGCPDSKDTLAHYLCCAPLWHMASEVMGQQGEVDITSRLCIRNPSLDDAVRLALCFQGYHYTKTECNRTMGLINASQDHHRLQQTCVESMKSFYKQFY